MKVGKEKSENDSIDLEEEDDGAEEADAAPIVILDNAINALKAEKKLS